jgi:hypothetical protein
MIGGGLFLVVIAVAIFSVRQWQAPAYDIETEKEDIIHEIAELDDDFEAGQIDEAEYLDLRESLLEELRAIWNE